MKKNTPDVTPEFAAIAIITIPTTHAARTHITIYAGEVRQLARRARRAAQDNAATPAPYSAHRAAVNTALTKAAKAIEQRLRNAKKRNRLVR